MSNKTNKLLIVAAILTMSFVQMGTNGIASIIADIAAEFPDAGTSTVQFLMTFPCFFIIFISLLSAFLTKHISKKTLASIGSILVSISGILAFSFHSSLTILFVWGALMGIGIGLVSPIAVSMISDFFEEGSERNHLMGLQNSASNIGSMIMTFIGGILAIFGWQYTYFVYLIAIPGLLLCIFSVPNIYKKEQHNNVKIEKAEQSAHIKIPKHVFLYCIIAFCLLILFNMGPTNLSLLVVELNIGSATLAGTAATFFLLGGTVVGLFFGKISSKIGNYSIPLGFLVQAIGFFILCHSDSVFQLFIGCFIAGTSISLCMPKCMLAAAQKGNAPTIAFSTAMVLSSGNLGTFATPFITNISSVVMNNNSTESRFVFASILGIIFSFITLIIFTIIHNRKPASVCNACK